MGTRGVKPQSIYRFYNAAGELLYLGLTNSLPARMKEHNEDRRKFVWWRLVARIDVEHLPPGTSRKRAEAIETAAIGREAPKFNKQGNRGRFDWAAYREAERDYWRQLGVEPGLGDQVAWAAERLAGVAGRVVAALRTWAYVTAAQAALVGVGLVGAGWRGLGPLAP